MRDFARRSEEHVLIALIAICLGAALASWIGGWGKSGHSKWPLLTHTQFRTLDTRAALFWAFALIALSLSIAWFLLYEVNAARTSLLTSPGLFAASCALFFSVWGYINTCIVRYRQEQQIPGTEELLNDVNRELEARLRRVGRDSPIDFWMLDYAPGIGIRAAPTQFETFKELLLRLTGVGLSKYVTIHTVFSPATEVTEFHKSLKVTSSELQDAECLIDTMDKCRGTIWRSPDIGPLHIIIVDNVAFEYIVIPEADKSRSIGMRTEEVFIVEFLRDTIRSSLERAVTPMLRLLPEGIQLLFEPQDYICEVEIYLRKDVNFSAIPSRSNDVSVIRPWSSVCPTQSGKLALSLSQEEIGDNRYLRVRLVKKKHLSQRSPTSVASRILAIPPLSQSVSEAAPATEAEGASTCSPQVP